MLRKKIIILSSLILGLMLLLNNHGCIQHRILIRRYMWYDPMSQHFPMPLNSISFPRTPRWRLPSPILIIPLHQKNWKTAFTPDLIKPAKTVATSLPKIYNSWLKVGLGNYATSLAELNMSNVRSKQYAYGLYLYHKSSGGKVSARQ